ncbi:MAG: leucine--tRNA ligase [Patescibacteria group bacterium]|nr:leucine--tRNA ligase [Patescibacteria group bacterium]
MKKYDFSKIEKYWQKEWEKEQVYFAQDKSKKEKKYILIEFPYPSGEGLHIGHLRPYVAGDVYSRFLRMKGYEVMYPIGWDAFGLPAENFAIKKGVHPSLSTKGNIKNAEAQIKSWSIGFDWSREVNTTDPEYYKWTQWIFLQLYKAGLAYEAEGFINWCPRDKTGLANEEVVGGFCERCGANVEKKELRQWYLKITDYAEKLLEGLKTLDWPEKIKIQQENWIGKSEGAEIDFEVKGTEESIKVFTTRPDTLFGATYMVLAPEHEFVLKLKNKISNWKELEAYIKKASAKSEEERSLEKTGVKLEGVNAINPANKEEIPVFIANYVLSGYGTGAIMAVPAHDERDFEFAQKYNLEIKKVILPILAKNPVGSAQGVPSEVAVQSECWIGNGQLINSDKFDGMDSEKAKQEITKFVGGKKKIQYRLRDWVFSRQRYWGEPIPLMHCKACGIVPVPEEELPVTLPEVKKYEPTGTGESPLAAIDSWVNTKCPKCGGPAKRETNTMPQWAGSSWYYLRYADPNNKKEFANIDLLKQWLPVDVYFGGMEHTTLHLLYSRFWHQFLYDQKLVPTPEPYIKRVPHGIILGADGEKMSKSRGNVVCPDEIVRKFGADALRMYELFLGPHEAMVSWNEKGILGISRFLERVYKFFQIENSEGKDDENIKVLLHKTIKKVTEDINEFKFNTVISALMIFLNGVEGRELKRETKQIFLKLLAPFAPHLSEELWSKLGNTTFIQKEPWPEYNEKFLKEDNYELVVQVNGKVRAILVVSVGIKEQEAQKLALADEKVKSFINNQKIKKVIFVPDRLINFVV